MLTDLVVVTSAAFKWGVEACIKGSNFLLAAFGPSGTGKSYNMFGPWSLSLTESRVWQTELYKSQVGQDSISTDIVARCLAAAGLGRLRREPSH